MHYTPEQIAKIQEKEAATPEAKRRDPYANYREGYFHITLNVHDQSPVLGIIMGKADAPDGSPEAPRCALTKLGKKVEEAWSQIPSFYPHVENIEYMIMPDHVHMLLRLKPENKAHLGQIVRGFMIGCSHGYWDILGINWRQMRANGSVITQNYNDRDHTRSFRGPGLFVRGYNDVEAIGEEEIEIKRQYIRNNPRKRLIARSHPDCFRVHRNMKSANWTPERIMQGLCADRFIAADRGRQVEAWRQMMEPGIRNRHGKVSATLKFQKIKTTADGDGSTLRPILDLVGNMQLLQRPLYPLICHRADAQLFEQQKAAVLKVAREQGGVIVTACVSPREREIVKILQQELLPVVEVTDNGFGDRYKPAGKAFYAVAEGRRLEVSPWQYEYRRSEMRPVVDAQGRPVLNADGNLEMEVVPDISREMCLVMNELVRMIARREDDWWKG